jgi:hypothetical protein
MHSGHLFTKIKSWSLERNVVVHVVKTAGGLENLRFRALCEMRFFLPRWCMRWAYAYLRVSHLLSKEPVAGMLGATSRTGRTQSCGTAVRLAKRSCEVRKAWAPTCNIGSKTTSPATVVLHLQRRQRTGPGTCPPGGFPIAYGRRVTNSHRSDHGAERCSARVLAGERRPGLYIHLLERRGSNCDGQALPHRHRAATRSGPCWPVQ